MKGSGGWHGRGVGTLPAVLRVDADAHRLMLAHALAGFPDEACGLMGGTTAAAAGAGADYATVDVFVPARNLDASSRTYSIGPDGFAAADDALGPLGLDVVGVMHSHTHTAAWPSPTDVDKADNPLLLGWRFVIVSLREVEPVLRSFVITGRMITEEAVAVDGR